jgi:hypothetical protein
MPDEEEALVEDEEEEGDAPLHPLDREQKGPLRSPCRPPLKKLKPIPLPTPTPAASSSGAASSSSTAKPKLLAIEAQPSSGAPSFLKEVKVVEVPTGEGEETKLEVHIELEGGVLEEGEEEFPKVFDAVVNSPSEDEDGNPRIGPRSFRLVERAVEAPRPKKPFVLLPQKAKIQAKVMPSTAAAKKSGPPRKETER